MSVRIKTISSEHKVLQTAKNEISLSNQANQKQLNIKMIVGNELSTPENSAFAVPELHLFILVLFHTSMIATVFETYSLQSKNLPVFDPQWPYYCNMFF